VNKTEVEPLVCAEEDGARTVTPSGRTAQADASEQLLRRAPKVLIETPLQPRALLPLGGTLVAGRLQILRRIGEGGMGVVYEAFDTERRGKVALKTLSRLDASGIYHLKNEFRSLAGVVHPNLCRLHELYADGEQWFFTMDLVDGDRFDVWVRPGRGLDEAMLRNALAQLVTAVSAIHAAGKLHRDLKPSNVLVTPGGRVVVLDFGLAADPELGGVGQTASDQSVSGTPGYMAPEQAAGRPATAASDFYALGVMLFEALTGELPFDGRVHEILVAKQERPAPLAQQRNPSAPRDLCDLAAALLRRDPHLRPDAAALRAAIGAHADSVPPPAPATAPAADETPALVGREQELAELRRAYEDARLGNPVVMVVSGESGMGKSALVDAFLSDLRAEGHAVVLAGRCYERESVPFKALDSLVDELSRHLRRLTRAEAAALLPREMFALAKLFPVLDRVAVVAEAPKKDIPDPQELQRRAVDAFGELLGRIRDRRPLCVHVDDMQWTDRDSTLFMRRLMVNRSPVPALLIVSHRSEVAEQNTLLERVIDAARANRLITVRALPIGPLPADATAALAQRLLGPEVQDAAALAEAIARESGGSPFFTAELARHARRAGQLAAGKLSLASVLAARVGELPRGARRLLEVLALIGKPLSIGVALEAAPADHEDIDVLRSSHLLRTGGSSRYRTLECYHDRVRESVAAGLSPEECRERYAALARTLAADRDADPELKSLCYEGAGLLAEAAQLAAIAARNAEAAMAFDHAAALYRKALDLGTPGDEERAQLARKLGEALENAGRGVEAADAYQKAAALSLGEVRIDLRRRAAEQLMVTGHAVDGTGLLREVCAEIGLPLPASPAGAMAAFLWARARLRLREPGTTWTPVRALSARRGLQLETSGTLVTALMIYSPVLAAASSVRYLLMADASGDPRHLVRALGFQAYLLAFADPASARPSALLDRAEQPARRDGRPELLGFVQLMRGATAYHGGRYADAREQLSAALETFRGCSRVAWEIDVAHLYEQLAALSLGDLTYFVRTTPGLIEDAFARGRVWVGALLTGNVGIMPWLVPDDPAGARARIEEAKRRWTPLADIQWPDWFLLQAEVYLSLYEGEPERGVQLWEAAWPRLKRSMLVTRAEIGRTGTHTFRAGAILAALRKRSSRYSPDQRTRLRKNARESLRVIAQPRTPTSRLWLATTEAAVALERGDDTGARAALRRAIEVGDFYQLMATTAAARRRLGHLIGGDEGQALVERGDATLRAQGVVNLEAMTRMLVPGCEPA